MKTSSYEVEKSVFRQATGNVILQNNPFSLIVHIFNAKYAKKRNMLKGFKNKIYFLKIANFCVILRGSRQSIMSLSCLS